MAYIGAALLDKLLCFSLTAFVIEDDSGPGGNEQAKQSPRQCRASLP